jgi:hypothetical protein
MSKLSAGKREYKRVLAAWRLGLDQHRGSGPHNPKWQSRRDRIFKKPVPPAVAIAYANGKRGRLAFATD